MASIPLDKVIKIVDQLTPTEQTALVIHLLETGKHRQLSIAERKALFEASILDMQVANVPSGSREDWYDDDGR